jgi:hypothetical protein
MNPNHGASEKTGGAGDPSPVSACCTDHRAPILNSTFAECQILDP